MATSFQDLLYSTNTDHSPQSRSNRESNLNSPFLKIQDSHNSESEYKWQQVGKMYEKRLAILKQSLSDAFGIAQSDNLLFSMKNDVSSSEYAYERVKQVIEKCINDDREALVDKLCQEIADLKSEYFKLDQQNMKAASQYEEKIDEIARKTTELKEKYQNEQRIKEKYEDEAKDMHQTLNNLRLSNEQALKKKEEMIIKLKQEKQELNMYQDQSEKLEYMLQESDNKYKRLQQEHNDLLKEIIHLRGKSKEQDKNINSLNSIIDDMQRIIDESDIRLKEKEKIEIEYKCELDLLQGKNEKLEANIAAMDNHERLLKEEFNYKIEQIESEILNDRSNQEKSSATFEDRYKTKLKQKQDKIYQYKDQLIQQDAKIEELEKQLKEASEAHNKEKEADCQTFEEQKRIYEENMRDIEREFESRIEDIKRRDHQEFVALQNKFEKMLEKIMRQTQEEANHKIAQISDETKSLKQALQRKEEKIGQDHTKLERYDKLIEEKTNLIERLKHEWANREAQNVHEVDLRFKEQREKLVEDYSIQTAILKNCMVDLERQIMIQQSQKIESEKEIGFLKETNQNLKVIIKELEFEKQKTFENINEWSIKMEKLREAYEEEQTTTAELRQQISEEARNYEEVLKHLNTVCEDLAKKDKNVNTLTGEFENLEIKHNQLQEEHRKLEEQHQILKKETTNRGNERDIKINSLVEESNVFRENNKKLKEKLTEVTQEYETKSEKLNSIQSETTLQLRKEEDRVRALDFEAKVLQKQVVDLEASLSETERIKKELSSENEKIKIELIGLSQEKQKAQGIAKEASTKLYLLKKQIEGFVSSKISSLRTEVRDLKKFYVDSFNLYAQEIELKIQNLLSAAVTIFQRKSHEYSFAVENLERLMKLETESLVEKTMKKAKQVQKDILQNYEYKCDEQEKQIQRMEPLNKQMNEQILTLQKERYTITAETSSLKEENKEMRIQLLSLKEEINNKEKQFQKLKKGLIKEIDEKKKVAIETLHQFEKEKELSKEKHNIQIEELKSQLETLKHKYAISLSAYEQRMNSFSLKQFEEAEELENSYKESLHKLQLTLDDTILGKDKLTKEAELLREKNSLLQKKSNELERAKTFIENISYRNSQEAEETVQKLREGLLKENFKIVDAKKAFKEGDANFSSHLIHQDGEEVRNEREMSDLAVQNEKLQWQIVDLEDRILSNNKYIQGKREKIRNYPQPQNQKDISSYGVISSNYSSPLESPYADNFKWGIFGNPCYNVTSSKLDKRHELQYASKTPKTKSYFFDQGIDRKVFSERESMH